MMFLKTTLAAFALILVPGFALAQGCSFETQSMSCAEGQIWDAESGTCITPNA